MKRMTTPTIMLPRPAMRSSRSPRVSSFSRARFIPAGLRKGIIPSTTKNSASAASRSEKWNVNVAGPADYRRPGSLRYLKNSPSGLTTRMSPSLPSERS